MDETLRLAVVIGRILERLGVDYFICGSLASSQHGVPRTTLDADLVARLSQEHITPFLQALGDDWYADEAAMRAAVKTRSSFNLIHFESVQKVDVFVAKSRPFDRHQFAAAAPLSLGEDGGDYAPCFASAGHTVVAKLEWFRLGGEISDRQWSDIIGVIQVQGPHLDRQSMEEDAASLGVADLLRRAFDEADCAW